MKSPFLLPSLCVKVLYKKKIPNAKACRATVFRGGSLAYALIAERSMRAEGRWGLGIGRGVIDFAVDIALML